MKDRFFVLRLSLIFVTTMSLCWLIAWLSGYDFDDRNIFVATFAVASVIISFTVTACFSFGEPSDS